MHDTRVFTQAGRANSYSSFSQLSHALLAKCFRLWAAVSFFRAAVMSVSRFTPRAVKYTAGPCRIAKDFAFFVVEVFANLLRHQGRNLSIPAKCRASDIMAMVYTLKLWCCYLSARRA